MHKAQKNEIHMMGQLTTLGMEYTPGQEKRRKRRKALAFLSRA
jgi:hypothetical protein